MARYKPVDRSPRFLPIVLESQLIPGSFEHALDVLVDTEVDLSGIAARFCNDETGAPAYDPAVMLKIVLLAYSRGVVSSRAIERLCRENVLFMAISGDSAPRFTTIAAFVRELGEEASAIFTQVLLACDRLGLIGRQMFAIDGVKLPSNASKRRSGTRADFERQATKLEATAHAILQRHRVADALPTEPPLPEKDWRRGEPLHRDAGARRGFREVVGEGGGEGAEGEMQRAHLGGVENQHIEDERQRRCVPQLQQRPADAGPGEDALRQPGGLAPSEVGFLDQRFGVDAGAHLMRPFSRK